VRSFPPNMDTDDTLLHRQIRGLGVLLLTIAVGLSIRAALNRQTIPDPQTSRPALYDTLETRLDPNTATVAELSAIPNLGEVKAHAIVDFRQAFLAAHPGQRAFSRREDLLQIKGIGPATVELLNTYLRFDTR